MRSLGVEHGRQLGDVIAPRGGANIGLDRSGDCRRARGEQLRLEDEHPVAQAGELLHRHVGRCTGAVWHESGDELERLGVGIGQEPGDELGIVARGRDPEVRGEDRLADDVELGDVEPAWRTRSFIDALV